MDQNTRNGSERLFKVDKRYRVSQTVEANKAIADDVTQIITLVKEHIQRKDPLLKCCVAPSGSFFSDLKVFGPDEFDFMLTLSCFTEENAFRLSRNKLAKDFFEVEVFPESRNKFDKFLDDGGSALNVNSFLRYLGKQINDAVVSNKNSFPSGWTLSKYYEEHDAVSKDFLKLEFAAMSGLSVEYTNNQGPATSFDFNRKMPNSDKDLKVNVDIVPVIVILLNSETSCGSKSHLQLALSPESWAYGIARESLARDGVYMVPAQFQNGGFLLPVWKLSAIMVENAVISQFPPESTEKTCLRVLKILMEKFAEKRQAATPVHHQASDTKHTPPMENSIALACSKLLHNCFALSEKYKMVGNSKCPWSSYQMKICWLRVLLQPKALVLRRPDQLEDLALEIIDNFIQEMQSSDRSHDALFNIPVSKHLYEDDKAKVLHALHEFRHFLEIFELSDFQETFLKCEVLHVLNVYRYDYRNCDSLVVYHI